jgi:hypothetical protein
MNIVKRILLTLLVVVGGIALYLTVRHYLDQELVTEPGIDPTALPRLAVVAETRLEPPGPTDVMGFGRAAALSGDTLAVGAHNWVGPGFPRSGVVFVYGRNGSDWEEVARLQAASANDTTTADRFGTAVALDGDTLAVGAPGADDPALGESVGAVYIFQQQDGSWVEQAQLQSSQAAAFAGFGAYLALDGDTLVVGQQPRIAGPGDRPPPSPLTIFRRSDDTWTEEARLLPEDEDNETYFGFLALEGDLLAVSAFRRQEPPARPGPKWMVGHTLVYLYERQGNTWQEQGQLTAPDSEGNAFGASIALQGNTLVVGATGDADVGLFGGAAYVFVRQGNEWRQQAKLTAADGQQQDAFGIVAIDGDTLIVGAPMSSAVHFQGGVAYAFQRQGQDWFDVRRLMAGDPENIFGGFYGANIALEDQTLMISAASEYGGAVYVYELQK